MRRALSLAQRGYGHTSPNPLVGAVLVKGGRVIGQGWHHQAGQPHAEIEALHDARRRKNDPRNATLYVTLEPCCTHGRTPPCTEAIIHAGIRTVVVGATDPNPQHCGKAFSILKRAGITVRHGVLRQECERLNESFNHWIVHGTPWVIVKAAMTLDGKIATAAGESKWITSPQSRAYATRLRLGADAILVGINTILADDPALTFRPVNMRSSQTAPVKQLRRIILDSQARTPLDAQLITDDHRSLTTIVVTKAAPQSRVSRLAKRVRVLVAPAERGTSSPGARSSSVRLPWLLKTLGAEAVTSLLVEGGGEVNASFLLAALAHRVAFFYAPKVLGGADSRKTVAGAGTRRIEEALALRDVEWRRLGPDWLLEAIVAQRPNAP